MKDHLMQLPEYLRLFLIAVYFVLLLFRVVKEMVDWLGSRRVSHERWLLDNVDNCIISQVVRGSIVEKVNAIAFYRATGIYVENPLRDRLVALIYDEDNDIHADLVRSSISYIHWKDGCLCVDLTFGDKFDYYLTCIVAVISYFLSLMMFLLLVWDCAKSREAFAIASLGAVVFMMIAVYMFWLSQPYKKARKLKGKLITLNAFARQPL